MKAFVYRAALYCEDCGNAIRRDLTAEGKAPANIADEVTYESDAFPKGPYSYGGGEADTPQHCENCGAFLANPLTGYGSNYVHEAAAQFATDGADQSWDEIARVAEASEDGFKGNGPVVAQWIRFYLAPGQ